MAAFAFSCPHCGRSLSTSKELRGQTVRCPSCRDSIELPDAGGVPPVRRDPHAAEARIREIRGRGSTALTVGVLGLVLGLGLAALAPWFAGGQPRRLMTMIERAHASQEERIVREALVFSAALLAGGFGLAAVLRGRKAQRMAEESDLGRQGTGSATVALYVGGVAMAAGAIMLGTLL